MPPCLCHAQRSSAPPITHTVEPYSGIYNRKKGPADSTVLAQATERAHTTCRCADYKAPAPAPTIALPFILKNSLALSQEEALSKAPFLGIFDFWAQG
jgi:hypothetical protein